MKNKSLQKEAFQNFEANAWFNRNKKALLEYTTENDKIISLIRSYKIEPTSVLEIGCSGGWRLNGIKSIFPNTEVFGIEPSKEAIIYGKKTFPNVNFIEGTSDLINFEDEKFDLAIIGFVLYVVDRNLLLRTISEVDRVLKNKGVLLLIDFYSESPVKKKYHHITDFAAYSFKQRYDEVFTSTQIYQLIDRTCFNHESKKPDASSDYKELYSVSLLKKDLLASYK